MTRLHSTTSGVRYSRLLNTRGRMLRVASLALICALPFATAALAQHEHHSDEDSLGWVPREILQRPVTLREGIGNISDPVTTSSPEAQAFYNQGLAYLHSYVWIERLPDQTNVRE